MTKDTDNITFQQFLRKEVENFTLEDLRLFVSVRLIC